MENDKKISKWYADHGTALLRYLARMTGDRDMAEDLLHDTFVKTLLYSQKQEIDEKTVRGLLFRTGHNAALNYIARRQKRELELVDSSFIEGGSDPADLMELHELEREISRIMAEMDPLTRSIFYMRKDSLMSNAEIADVTGKSERTIRRRLEEALDRLYRELEQKGFLE